MRAADIVEGAADRTEHASDHTTGKGAAARVPRSSGHHSIGELCGIRTRRTRMIAASGKEPDYRASRDRQDDDAMTGRLVVTMNNGCRNGARRGPESGTDQRRDCAVRAARGAGLCASFVR